MTREQLFLAIGHCDDRLLAESQDYHSSRRPRRLLAAACVLLVLLGSFGTAVKLDYFKAGCGGWPGTIVDGTYYFTIPHKGAYRYTPGSGESQKVRGALWMDGWQVNEYGFYFKQGRGLYVLPHGEDKARRLYKAPLLESSHIGFDLTKDGGVILTVYNKWAEHKSKLRLDGKTGEVLEVLYERLPYSQDEPVLRVYSLGDRTVTLEGVGYSDLELLEDGRGLLPQGIEPEPWPTWVGESLMVRLWDRQAQDTAGQLLLTAEGEHLIDNTFNWWDGAEGYLYAVDDDGEVLCFAVQTGEVFRLARDAQREVYELETDGQYLYTTAPWAEGQVCWHIEYDAEGRPSRLIHVADFG